MNLIRPYKLHISFVVLTLGMGASYIFSFESSFLLWKVLSEAVTLLGEVFFYREALLPSLFRLSIALGVSIPLAILLSTLCHLSYSFDKIFSGMVYTTFAIPKVALFPLFLVIFGIGSTSQILLILTGTFYLLFSSIDLSFKKIKQSSISDVSRVYQLSEGRFIYNILFKGSVSSFLSGLKSATGYGLVLVVVSESTASVNGIGHMIWQFWDRYEIEKMYATIFILALLGLFFQITFDYFIKRNLSREI